MIDEMHLERAVVFAAETDAVMRVVLELDDADAIAAFPSLSFDADHFADLDDGEEDEVHGFAHAFLTLLDEPVEPVAQPVPPHLARYSADALSVIGLLAGEARVHASRATSPPRGEAVEPAKGELTQTEVLHTPPKIVRKLTIEFDDDITADAVLNMLAHVKGAKVTVGKAGGC